MLFGLKVLANFLLARAAHRVTQQNLDLITASMAHGISISWGPSTLAGSFSAAVRVTTIGSRIELRTSR